MSLWRARLSFLEGVHFGRLEVGLESVEETLHSDSLYSALCHAWSALFGADDLTGLIGRFQKEPPFLISSAFPYSSSSFFLPKPLTRAPGFEEEKTRQEYGKDLKKAEYVPLEVFASWVRGEPFPPEVIKEWKAVLKRASQKSLVPRVALGRENAVSEIFHVGVLRFAKDSGLYFLIRLYDENLQSKLRAGLSLLGEMGLGGERTYGLGRFTVEMEQTDVGWDFLGKEGGPQYLTLSLFSSTNSDLELVDESCSYALIDRKGWIHSAYTYQQFKRKTVVMFTEGSVFSRPLAGQVIDVTPKEWNAAASHPVYRFALPFFVSVQ